MEPLTGRSGLAETWPVAGGERVEVHLRLHPGHSILLKTFDKRVVHGPAWNWPDPTAEALALAGPWRVEFLEGGPLLPKPYETVALQSWTRSGDPETERFAGTAKYSLEFDAPEGAGPWMLDLGEVCHSARVRLNGEEIGCLIMHPYQVTFPGLKPGRNRLEVEVTNLSANRLRDMDKRKVPWRVFNDINFVSITYKPFDASTWPVMESGLLGPVVIRPVANKANTPKKQ
jgi:hypothetical protein